MANYRFIATNVLRTQLTDYFQSVGSISTRDTGTVDANSTGCLMQTYPAGASVSWAADCVWNLGSDDFIPVNTSGVFRFRMTAFPTASSSAFAIMVANNFNLTVDTTGNLQMNNTTVAALAINTWYTIEFIADANWNGAGSGAFLCRVNGGTPLQINTPASGSASITFGNTGSKLIGFGTTIRFNHMAVWWSDDAANRAPWLGSLKIEQNDRVPTGNGTHNDYIGYLGAGSADYNGTANAAVTYAAQTLTDTRTPFVLNEWTSCTVDAGASTANAIASNTTQVLQLGANWNTGTPANGTAYAIKANTYTATTLTDPRSTVNNYVTNALTGMVVTAGASTGTVTSNTPTVITVGSWSAGTPAAGTAYTVGNGTSKWKNVDESPDNTYSDYNREGTVGSTKIQGYTYAAVNYGADVPVGFTSYHQIGFEAAFVAPAASYKKYVRDNGVDNFSELIATVSAAGAWGTVYLGYPGRPADNAALTSAIIDAMEIGTQVALTAGQVAWRNSASFIVVATGAFTSNGAVPLKLRPILLDQAVNRLGTY